MMSLEGPFIAALIARLPDPKFNLAAYGIAFSFALLIEAPIIMIMSASTALVNNNDSFKKLRNFTYFLNLFITLFMLFTLIPDIFYFITIDLMTLPDHVAKLTHYALLILLPWPSTIGYRRFYQGILIKNNLTNRVAYGTVLRLTSMTITAITLFLFTKIPGSVVGAAAMSIGVTVEAIASKLMCNSTLKKIKEKESQSAGLLKYSEITKFYYPLALTSMLSLGVQPMVSFFLGQSRMAIESLAVLPVINSLVFIFRSVGLSFQEVGIALMGHHGENYSVLKKFAQILGFSATFILVLIAVTPVSEFWFRNVSGLSMELTQFAILPLIIISIMPGLSVMLSFERSVLVYAKKTSPITFATAIEVIGIILILFITVKYFNWIGVIAATTAFTIGRLGSISYLIPSFIKTTKQYEGDVRKN